MRDDSIQKVRDYLPPLAKIAFVYPLGGKDYTALYSTGGNLKWADVSERGASCYKSEMMDDGLSDVVRDAIRANDGFVTLKHVEANSKLREREKWVENSFRIASGIEKEIIQNFIPKLADASSYVASGTDLVLISPYAKWTGCYRVDRSDWDFGYDLIQLLVETPPLMMPDGKYGLNQSNIESCFRSILRFLREGKSTDRTRKLVLDTWMSFRDNLAPCQYHPELGPLFEKVQVGIQRFVSME